MSATPPSSALLINNNDNKNNIPIPNPVNNNIHQMYNNQRPAPLLPDPSLDQFQNSSSFGKRTLADFQAHHQHHHHHHHHNPLLLRHLQQQHQHHQGVGIGIGIGIGAPYMRSVKPRIYHNPTPISTLSHIHTDNIASASFNNNNNTNAYIGRYAQLGPIGFGTGSVVPNHSYNQNFIQSGAMGKSATDSAEAEKTIIMNRLQELEKQLLDDDDADVHAGDSVSVITTGNEWTETIQNLLAPTSPHKQQQQPVKTSSPTSSSSSCSSTVASPLPICHIQLITEAASAIAEGKFESAAEIVTRVSQSANPRGTPDQRLAFYMSLSLKSKLSPVDGSKSASTIRSKEHRESVQLLYHRSNCFKLGFSAANLAIIEATVDAKSLHVVDFDLGDGRQYHSLFQFLALRKSGKPASVKITAVDVLERGDVGESSRIALERLSERVGIVLQVKTLRLSKVGDLTREWLSSDENEVLAVNMAYVLSKLPDESVSTENQRDELLRRVNGLKARIVTVVEQEMNCNTAPLQTRVAECCSFYGALFDSLENSGMGREDSDRIRAEEGAGRAMMNTLTCEGGERVERCEVLGKWRARMGMAGFEMKPVSRNVVDSLSSRVNNSVSGGGTPLFVKDVNGSVGFGWMGRILTVTSAWS